MIWKFSAEGFAVKLEAVAPQTPSPSTERKRLPRGNMRPLQK
jgi:hypothetical protein